MLDREARIDTTLSETSAKVVFKHSIIAREVRIMDPASRRLAT